MTCVKLRLGLKTQTSSQEFLSCAHGQGRTIVPEPLPRLELKPHRRPKTALPCRRPTRSSLTCYLGSRRPVDRGHFASPASPLTTSDPAREGRLRRPAGGEGGCCLLHPPEHQSSRPTVGSVSLEQGSLALLDLALGYVCMSFYNNVKVLLYRSDNQGTLAGRW